MRSGGRGAVPSETLRDAIGGGASQSCRNDGDGPFRGASGRASRERPRRGPVQACREGSRSPLAPRFSRLNPKAGGRSDPMGHSRRAENRDDASESPIAMATARSDTHDRYDRRVHWQAPEAVPGLRDGGRAGSREGREVTGGSERMTARTRAEPKPRCVLRNGPSRPGPAGTMRNGVRTICRAASAVVALAAAASARSTQVSAGANAVGGGAGAGGDSTVANGQGANAPGSNSPVVGRNALDTRNDSMAPGASATRQGFVH